ncbi:MAG TPA: altronate dehydratase family protein [Acidimicrobiales bacterium]|nr:altronate dehydratase family protein [Acidimicrobiales bacterium]
MAPTEQATKPYLTLRAGDSVGIATRALHAGEDIDAGGHSFTLSGDIPAGHKLALADIPAGADVRKYGQIIGVATTGIKRGDHVHSHNLAFARFERDYAFGADLGAQSAPGPSSGNLAGTTAAGAGNGEVTFQGIVRPDGRVATRNFIGVLTTVNCSATVARMIAAEFRGGAGGPLAQFPNVDGVVALTHGSGCGMAPSGEGFDLLRRTLSGYAMHPNFAALVVLGLGCEVNQVRALTEGFELPSTTPLIGMTIQEMGGTRATVREGVARVTELAAAANEVKRVPVPVSELVLGLECGGSDGYSGVTANPALGMAADLLVRNGGTAVLGETPEIYGAEHLLTRRAVSEEVGKRLVERVHWWEDYVQRCGASLDNNPSPGNKEGGLTTILEKSLGAVAKGGSMPLSAVYEYAEPITAKGFVFMDTPGYDPVSVTGIVAGGANVVCFTTGRGSVFGSKPAPCIKLATNSDTYRRMEEDMDIDCGPVLDGSLSLEQAGRQIFDLIVSVAGGTKTKSEELGFGDEEFTPWQLGAVL